MGRPRTVTNAQILRAAREIFIEQGPRAPTAVIAERLGLSQAALFKRFGTKEELLMAAVRPPPPPWLAQVQQGPDERPIPEQLKELGVQIAEFMDDLVPRMGVLHAAGIDPRKMMESDDVPPPIQNFASLKDWFRRAQAAGRIGPGKPETITLSFLGALNASAFFKHLARVSIGIPDREVLVDDLVELLWRSIAPSEG
ncbi:MAG: TetR/AcrR family transcriptional regulator [bacterium]